MNIMEHFEQGAGNIPIVYALHPTEAPSFLCKDRRAFFSVAKAPNGKAIVVESLPLRHLSQVPQFVNDTILVVETADGSDIKRPSGPIKDDASVAEGLVSHLTVHSA
jgi:hypothetical protein